ncbi:MAG: T9SS type A sorting domain-containing protein [Saprospiraceae bacterium]
MRFLILFSLLIGNTLLAQQKNWERIRSIVPIMLRSFDADSSGNYFYSMYHSPVVVLGNVFSLKQESFPRINEIRFNSFNNHVDVFIDKGQVPIVVHSNTVYIYRDDQFSIDTNRLPSGNFDQLRYDENSNLYALDWKYIFRKKNGLYSYDSKKLAEFSDWIQAAFMYNRDSNYLVISEFESNKADIVQLNSESGEYKVLVSIYAPMREVDQSLLYKDGRFIIPTDREIYYYKDYGKYYISPVIDSADQNLGKITSLTAGKVNGEIVVIKGSKFYFSYDDLKTWVQIGVLNNGFPKGFVKKLVVWDSLHAVSVVADDCGHDRFYIFDSSKNRWRQDYQPDYDNSDFSRFEVDENNNLIGQVFTCGWNFKNQLDSVWTPIYNPGKMIGNFEGYLQNYLITDKKDFGFNDYTLYSTEDYGKTWDPVQTFPNSIRSLNYFGEGYILLSTTSGNSYNFYASKDFGKSFNYLNSTSSDNFPIDRLMLDFDGNLIAPNFGSSSSPFFKLKEGSKNWTIDERFNNLKCRGFDFSEDGRYFLDIEFNGQRGIYTTYNFKSFNNITEKIGYTFAYTIKYMGNGELIFSTNNHDGIRGVYYSKDYGESIQDVTYDLPYFRDDIQFGSISEFYLDKERKLYLTMSDNGIYKLSNALTPVYVKDIEVNSMNIIIYPQPSKFEINILTSKNILFDHYKIFDSIGKQIKSGKLENNQILINDLLIGVYTLQLIQDDKVLRISRIMKV